MFTAGLFASGSHRVVHLGDLSLSTVIHSVVIGFAFYTTAQTVSPYEHHPMVEDLVFVQAIEGAETSSMVAMAEPEPVVEEEPYNGPEGDGGGDGGGMGVGTLPPDVIPAKGFQVLSAPVNIPDVLPGIDLTRAVTNEDDFSGRGEEGGVAHGITGGRKVNLAEVQVYAPKGSGVAPRVQAYFEFQVEKAVVQVPGTGVPRYPEILREGAIEGEVLLQFVVDTSGRAMVNTVKVLQSTHDLFTVSVRSSLPEMRFLPAEVGGRKVRQLVQQPFIFAMAKP